MLTGSYGGEQILTYLEAVHKRGILTEPEFISIAWTGLITSVDMTTKPELIGDLAIKEIVSIAPLLEPFCQKPATEVALMYAVPPLTALKPLTQP